MPAYDNCPDLAQPPCSYGGSHGLCLLIAYNPYPKPRPYPLSDTDPVCSVASPRPRPSQDLPSTDSICSLLNHNTTLLWKNYGSHCGAHPEGYEACYAFGLKINFVCKMRTTGNYYQLNSTPPSLTFGYLDYLVPYQYLPSIFCSTGLCFFLLQILNLFMGKIRTQKSFYFSQKELLEVEHWLNSALSFSSCVSLHDVCFADPQHLATWYIKR